MNTRIGCQVATILSTALLMCTSTIASAQSPFDPVQDDPKLPRVLLIGDSISIGYTVPVQQSLKGKANVHRIPVNGGYSSYGLANIKQWLGDGRWDVIHFNWGIWDTHTLDSTGAILSAEDEAVKEGKIRATIAQYQENLNKIIDIMEPTGARLIWATTTPMTCRKGERFRLTDRYNTAAASVMRSRLIETDDLCTLIRPHLSEMQSDDGCHFTEQGYDYLGKQVAERISAALSSEISLSFDKIGANGLPKGQSIVKGVVGNALHLDGSPDGRVAVPAAGFSAPATISAWVKTDCPRSDYRLVSRLDDGKDPIGTIRFEGSRVQTWNGDAWKELAPFIAVNGSWQHLAIAFREDGTATAYVNGREKKSDSCGFDFAGAKFGIGAGFAGDIDEFRIYRKALSGNEIRRLYSPKLFDRAEREDGTAPTALGKVALEESLEPIRPGIPGVRPFWNSHSRRFIYAPAFDFPPVSGAQCYRFTATSSSDGSANQFEADTPTAALSPIWTKITAGPVSLKVEGLDKPGGTVLGVAGTRDFIKSPPFNGPYSQRACGNRECGTASLAAQFHQEKLQTILVNGKPSGDYHYASKFMGAVTAGMTYYSGLSPDPTEARGALEMARLSADFLISLSEKAGSPLAGWPPTYWNGLPPDDPGRSHERIMTSYPAEAAMSYLDLYDATRDAKYLAAARAVADTYLRLRLKCGTWYQIMDAVTGKPTAPNLLIPTYVIRFFDRLSESYGITEYQAAREKAFNWIMANTMKTYNWQGQFEDVAAMKPYEDQSNQEVTEMSALLFRASIKRPEYLSMAEDLLRFAEDQFVVWDRRDALAGPNWAIPSALEQYVCYTPISGSNHSLMRAYMAGYEVTGDPTYRAKAMALADTLTVAWKDFGCKEIPTWMNFGAHSDNWINCSVYTAITLIECDKVLSGKREH